jgi:hypothetical protein
LERPPAKPLISLTPCITIVCIAGRAKNPVLDITDIASVVVHQLPPHPPAPCPGMNAIFSPKLQFGAQEGRPAKANMTTGETHAASIPKWSILVVFIDLTMRIAYNEEKKPHIVGIA